MYNNTPSHTIIISEQVDKKVFDKPQDLSNKEKAVEKARKDLKKAGFFSL